MRMIYFYKIIHHFFLCIFIYYIESMCNCGNYVIKLKPVINKNPVNQTNMINTNDINKNTIDTNKISIENKNEIIHEDLTLNKISNATDNNIT